MSKTVNCPHCSTRYALMPSGIFPGHPTRGWTFNNRLVGWLRCKGSGKAPAIKRG